MIRRLPLLLALTLLAAGCAYESSGTTTTTTVLSDEEPVPTGPADIVAADQRSEGSSVTIDSLSLPAAGWVVARADAGGSPGEIIGISERLSKGVISGVEVPFLVPLEGSATVFLTVHIDVDEDGEFRYEPPDGFIDQVASKASGDAATAVVTITLLPPLGPSSALLDAQVSDGSSIVAAGGLFSAPGFLVVHADDGGTPGVVLGVSARVPAGEVGPTTIALDPELDTTGPVTVVVWIDRDEDGSFTPGEDGDEMGVTEDGALAAATAVVTVLRRGPAALSVTDQEVPDDEFVVATLAMPAPGFLEVLADDGGAPGARLAVVVLPVGEAEEVEVALPAGTRTGARLWLRLWIDFDQSGDLGDGDVQALTATDGEPVEASFVITLT